MITGTYPATVAVGATESNIISLDNLAVVGLMTPSALSSTAITIRASSSTMDKLKTVYGATGSALSITVAASRFIGFTQDITRQLSGARYIQLVCGSTESAGAIIDVVAVHLV